MRIPIEISDNKILKLTNACLLEITGMDGVDISRAVIQLTNYIKMKKTAAKGPLIQYMELSTDETVPDKVFLIQQTDRQILDMAAPFHSEQSIRSGNCLYAHFSGEQEHLHFAYDKLTLAAYENEIDLSGRVYTVYVKQEDDTLTADVFMEKKQ